MRTFHACLVKATNMILPITRVAALGAALALVASTSAQPPLPPPDKQDAQLPVPKKQDAKQDDALHPEPGITVAEKGPIHEAFAQPGAEIRGKGMTAPKKPPAPIPEVPPETKPDGDNVKWIPGYWQWDKEKEDFLWVSGFWRTCRPAGPGKGESGSTRTAPGRTRPASGGRPT